MDAMLVALGQRDPRRRTRYDAVTTAARDAAV